MMRGCIYCSLLFGLTIEGDEMGGACGTYEKEKNLYRVLVVKPE
jgi:hypothetical protein